MRAFSFYCFNQLKHPGDSYGSSPKKIRRFAATLKIVVKKVTGSGIHRPFFRSYSHPIHYFGKGEVFLISILNGLYRHQPMKGEWQGKLLRESAGLKVYCFRYLHGGVIKSRVAHLSEPKALFLLFNAAAFAC